MALAGVVGDARTIGTGDLRATFRPALGMLGSSVRFRGVEMLRRIDDLEGAAAKGSTAGLPLLYPWANRLAGFRYLASGREVALDASSPLVHLDAQGKPMHGVPWGALRWAVRECEASSITATLDWTTPDLLAVFPFPHRIAMLCSVCVDGLTISTIIDANQGSAVPVSFGFHPYFGIPNLDRDAWRLTTPEMQRIVLDHGGIPTGAIEPFGVFDGPLAGKAFDDGFALASDRAGFALSGAGVRIEVDFLRGYGYAQLFAPKGKEYIAIEPMTAPTNALVAGTGYRIVRAGDRDESVFRIRVEVIP